MSKRIRVLMALLAGLAVVMASGLLGAGAASAAAPRAGVNSKVCNEAVYPPVSTTALISVNMTTVYSGQSVKVSGSGYCPNDLVTIMFKDHVEGTAQTDSNGAFDPTYVVDEPVGAVLVTGTGAPSGLIATTSFNVIAKTGAKTGTLAFTGSDIAMLIAAGVLLLGAGVVMTGSSRRRRTADSVH